VSSSSFPPGEATLARETLLNSGGRGCLTTHTQRIGAREAMIANHDVQSVSRHRMVRRRGHWVGRALRASRLAK
jgi:hypothetical protein